MSDATRAPQRYCEFSDRCEPGEECETYWWCHANNLIMTLRGWRTVRVLARYL